MEDEDREATPTITLEGLSEHQVRAALGAAGLTGFSMEIIPVSTEGEAINPVLGYASYDDLVRFSDSRPGYQASRVYTRLWNGLVRVSGLYRYSNTPPDEAGKIDFGGDFGIELFKSTGFTRRSPEIYSGDKHKGQGYLLNLDTLDALLVGSLPEIPNFGDLTIQFTQEFLDVRRAELELQVQEKGQRE